MAVDVFVNVCVVVLTCAVTVPLTSKISLLWKIPVTVAAVRGFEDDAPAIVLFRTISGADDPWQVGHARLSVISPVPRHVGHLSAAKANVQDEKRQIRAKVTINRCFFNVSPFFHVLGLKGASFSHSTFRVMRMTTSCTLA